VPLCCYMSVIMNYGTEVSLVTWKLKYKICDYAILCVWDKIYGSVV